MNPENGFRKGEGPSPASNWSQLKVFPTKRDQGKAVESLTKAILKVQKRKTKKERNCLKFKSQHKETFQKKGWPPGRLSRHDGTSNLSGVKMALQSSGKITLNSKKVFITHNRLTQHQGIFNHEVKSVDIARFIREATEVEAAKKNACIAATQLEGPSPQSHMDLVLDLIPTPEKNQEELPSPNHSPVHMVTEDLESSPESLKLTENENSERGRNPDLSIQDKEDHPKISLSGSRTRSFPDKLQDDPVQQVAENIANMLNLLAIFPGRNLVNETRQSILEMKRQLCGASSNLALPVRRELDYGHKDDTPTNFRWEHSNGERADCMKTIQRPRSATRVMQTPPTRFTSVPRGRPIHPPIQRVSPEEHEQRFSPVFQHSLLSVPPDYNPSQKNHQPLAEHSPHLFNISSSSKDSRLSRQGCNALTFNRANRHHEKHNLSANADSPQIRWRFTSDDLLHKHNALRENVRHIASPRMIEQRQPLLDISSMQLNLSGQKAKSSSCREKQPSFFVPQNIFEQHSPVSQVFDTSLTNSRACCSVLRSPRSNSKSRLESHQNIFPEDFASRYQSEDPLGLRNLKPLISSPLESDMFPVKYMPRWRNVYEPGDCTTWSPSSSLREANMHRVRGDNNYDNEWHSSSNCSLSTSHQNNQWRWSSTTATPLSIEQENSFFSLPFSTSLSNGLLDKTSPETWRYPRMKLY